MDTIFVVWSLIIVYFVAETALRKGKFANSYQVEESDQKTSHLLGLTTGGVMLAILISPLMNLYHIGELVEMEIVKWIGFGLMLVGLVIRSVAMIILGQFYSRTLHTAPDQHIVQQGPYRLIRHPGYLGSLLLWTGAGLATSNWIVALGVMVVLVLAYRSRIRAEETMLLDTFGQAYRDYSQHTWKLIPFVF